MARDHPLRAYGAFGFAVPAVFAGALATFAFRAGSAEEQIAIYAGLGLVVGSLLFGVYAGVQTWGDRAQPSITLTPKPGHLVAVTVRGAGLRAMDHIVVEVEQLVRAPNDAGRLTWKAGEPLYGASLGPDGDGRIGYTVDIRCRRVTTTTSAREPGSATSRRRATHGATRPAASVFISRVPRSGRSWRSRGRRLW